MKHPTNRSRVVSAALFAVPMLLLLASSSYASVIVDLGANYSRVLLKASTRAQDVSFNQKVTDRDDLDLQPASFPFIGGVSAGATKGSSSSTAAIDMDASLMIQNNSLTQFSASGAGTLGLAVSPPHLGSFAIGSFSATIQLSFSVTDNPTDFQFTGFVNSNVSSSDPRFRLRGLQGDSIISVPADAENLTLAQSGTLSPGSYFLELDMEVGEYVNLDPLGQSSLAAVLDYDLTLSFSALPPIPQNLQWIDSLGGNFSDSGNWSPTGIPSSIDKIIFDNSATYAVSLAETRVVNSIDVSDGDVTLNLNGHTLGVLGSASPLAIESMGGIAPHLTVTNGKLSAGGFEFARRGHGRLSVVGGAQFNAGSAFLGTLEGSEADLTVSGAQSQFNAKTMVAGSEGDAMILVEQGGALRTGRLAMGLEPTSNSQLTVQGSGSTLTVLPSLIEAGVGDGFMLVGFGGEASFALLDGASAITFQTRIGCADLSIPVPDPIPGEGPECDASHGSVLVSGTSTLWRNIESFRVGDSLAPGDLLVDGEARIETPIFDVSGSSSGEFRSTATFSESQTLLDASSSIGVGTSADLTFEQGASFETGLLSVFGNATLTGLTTKGQIRGGQTAVHIFSNGVLLIDDGAKLDSTSNRNFIGTGDFGDDPALVHLRGVGSTWDLGLSDLLISIDRFGVVGGNGELRLEGDALLRAHEILVGNGGRITGSNSTIQADVNLLGGTIAPGLSPGHLVVDGNVSVDADSQIIIEIGGTIPGDEYDVLQILGDATINGVIVFQFIDGFSPNQGDVFDFLAVSGVTDLTEVEYEIRNLAPGFDSEIMATANSFQFVALTNGTFVPEPSSLLLASLGLLGLLGKVRSGVRLQ